MTEDKDGGKKSWAPMALRRVGHVTELVKTGGGKGSPSPGDPGEPRKPPPDQATEG